MSPRDELIRWCTQYPPFLTPGDLGYFFGQLIEDDSDIHEYSVNGHRRVVFVLLRRIQNRQGWVPLDLAAHVPYTDIEGPLLQSLTRARSRIPPAAQGILLSLPSQYEFLSPRLLQAGCHRSHESAHMVAPTTRHRDPVDGVVEVPPADYPRVYEIMQRAFDRSPDIVIPDYEIWLRRREDPSARTFGIYDGPGQLVAFCNLVLHETFTDVRTLGVDPPAQGQGLAARLLRHALHYTRGLGKPNCELTVSVDNKKALALYEREGFATFSSTISWCCATS